MTAPSEADFQAAVVELAQLRGWYVFHVHDSRRGLGAGWPDLFLLHPRTGQVVVAELKTSTGRVSVAQQRWIDAFLLAGVVVDVWRPAHLRDGRIARALQPADVGAVTA